MSSQFPGSMDSFTDKVDNVDVIKASDINNLQDSVIRIENNLNLIVKDDSNLLTLCHFENKTSGYRNLTANVSGAIRYESGKYGNSVFIEEGTANCVKNPAFRLSDDLWTFVENTGSMSCTRVSSDFPPLIDTDYCLQVEVESAGDVDGTLKTTMSGLSAETGYAISFWVKNNVSSGNFAGDDMKIAYSGGSGASGPTFNVSSAWNRVSGPYTTASGQDSFVLEVHFSKSGAADGDQILLGGFQVEEGSYCSTYCDGDQGTGYTWTGGSNSSSSIRNDTVIQYPTSSASQVYLDDDTGSVGFWLKAEWDVSSSSLRYLFDTASGSSNKRLSIYKDTDNKLNMKIAEPGGDYAAIVTDQAVDWHPQDEWCHIACTYDFVESSSSWSLQAYVNGSPASTSSSGTASTSSALADYMSPGCSYEEEDFADGCFDDFFTFSKVMTSVEVEKIYDSPIQLTEGILRAATGSSTTDASAGTESSVAHGLGETPSFIEITEKGAGVVYLSDTADNQYFYVKSTASSIDFDWRAWK